MKYPSIDEVKEFAHATFKGDYDGDRLNVHVSRQGDGYVITIEKMYEYVSLNFPLLCAVSEFFDTRNINDSRYSHGGCDTCDYGSSYEITLTVDP